MTELEVEIYGKRYVLRGSSPEEITSVAKYMDQRMKELFGSEPRAIDLPKAFLLAMNFAEEIGNLKKQAGELDAELGKKLDQFLQKVAQLEKILNL